jgi:sulfite reductase (NADPH) flavoprotein alpha-component
MNIIPILYGTMTGNSRDLSERAAKRLKAAGFDAQSIDMAKTRPEELEGRSLALFIISTWGDGEPPDDAVPYVDRLQHDSPLSLQGLEFSVCALGDESYDIFCGCGKIVDERLEAHGGVRLAPRAECDIDYDEPFEAWLDSVMEVLSSRQSVSS